MRLEQKNHNLEEQHKMFYSRIEQLEADREMLISKHCKDKEHLENEVEEKRAMLKKYEVEFRDTNSHKQQMKKQMDEYELKIKRLIIEFEEEAKKHIKELNDVHEQCRQHKSQVLDLDQKLSLTRQEAHRAQTTERTYQ